MKEQLIVQRPENIDALLSLKEKSIVEIDGIGNALYHSRNGLNKLAFIARIGSGHTIRSIEVNVNEISIKDGKLYLSIIDNETNVVNYLGLKRNMPRQIMNRKYQVMDKILREVGI